MSSSPSVGWPAWLRRRLSSPRWPWQPRPLRPWRPTSCSRPGSSATASTSPPLRSAEPSPATIDATDCNIGVYRPDQRAAAPTSPARTTSASSSAADRQRDRQQGPRTSARDPFNGSQHGRAILYINGASGTISGNKVYDFQKNGIEVSGLAADGGALSSVKTSASVSEQHRNRRGPHRLHRPERHRDQERRERHREQEHRQRLPLHAGGTEATGLLLYEAGRVNVQNNKISDNEMNIYDDRLRRRPRQALAPASSEKAGVSTRRPWSSDSPVVSARSCAIRRTSPQPRPLPEPCSRSRMRLPPLVDGRRGGLAHHSMQTRQACLRRPPSVSAPDRERSREGGPAPLARTSRRRVPLGVRCRFVATPCRSNCLVRPMPRSDEGC